MSLLEIQNAAAKKLMDETISTTPGFCRNAVQLLLVLALCVDLTEPHAEVFPLVWPGPTSDPTNERIHYAFCAASSDGKLYINPVKAPGFPQFNMVTSCPPGRIAQMVKTDRVV